MFSACKSSSLFLFLFPALFSFVFFSRSDRCCRTARKCKRCWKHDGKRVCSPGYFWSSTLSFSWDIPSCRSYTSRIRDTIRFTPVCTIADTCSSFRIRCSRRTLNDGWLAGDTSDRIRNKMLSLLKRLGIIEALTFENRYPRRRTAV